jgi:hypothetical protein
MVEMSGTTTRVPVRGYPALPVTPVAGDEAVFDWSKNGYLFPTHVLNRDPSENAYVSATDYGARGNGSNDDTGAIQAALDDAAITGKWVRLPIGVYRITQTLRISSHNVRFVGMGRSEYPISEDTNLPATVLSWGGGAGETMLYIGTASEDVQHLSGIHVEGIALRGNGLSGIGLQINSCMAGRFRVSVEDCNSAGVLMSTDPLGAAPPSYGTQMNEVDIIGRQMGADNGPILQMQGTPDSNTCYNRLWVAGSYGGGDDAHGIVVGNTDHNFFERILVAHPATDNDAIGLVFQAGTNPEFARNNRVFLASINQGHANNTAVYFAGTEMGTTASAENIVQWLDIQFAVGTTVTYGTGALRNRVFRDAEFWDESAHLADVTADQDNWNPSGLSDSRILRFQTDASRNISGVMAQDPWARRTFVVVGSNPAVFLHNSGSSDAENRMMLRNAGNVTVAGGESITLLYDPLSDIWREVADSA